MLFYFHKKKLCFVGPFLIAVKLKMHPLLANHFTSRKKNRPFQKQRLLSRLTQLNGSGVLRIRASEQRSQYKNRCLALEKMAEALRNGLKPDPKPRRATKPSKSSTRKRLEGKRLRGDIKRKRQRQPRPED